ncbi:hypothetical protein [Photobacterium jeanii]|nr:hypothetical protein [Photobacterium jeanii]
MPRETEEKINILLEDVESIKKQLSWLQNAMQIFAIAAFIAIVKMHVF